MTDQLTVQNANIPVVFLMGPTASGKSELAIEMHKELGCEIVSVDSVLVYRGLNIGTAKPTAEELQMIPHHLIDLCEPDQPYSVSQFCEDAKAHIDKIILKGKVPLLVGGTMLYFRALRDGLADLPSAEQDVRAQIHDEASATSWQAMHEKLAIIDPESAARIKIGDSQRIQRALEVYQISGKTLSQHFKEQSIQPLSHPILNLAISPVDRESMREKIALRFELMLEQGLVDEVKNLYQYKGLSDDLPAMRSVGYRQVCQYLDEKMDYQLMKEKAITATRQLAKRQMTWLRQWPDLHWLETDDSQNVYKIKQHIEDLMRLHSV